MAQIFGHDTDTGAQIVIQVSEEDLEELSKLKWFTCAAYQRLPHTKLDDGSLVSMRNYIMKKILKIEFPKNEVVYNKDADTLNNRRDNLEVRPWKSLYN